MISELTEAVKGLGLWTTVGIVLGSYVLYTYVAAWWRLRHFPGPFLGKFSSLFMMKVWWSRAHAAGYVNINRKYGSTLVRIGPNDLMTDDPDMIKHMNGARSSYVRSSWYSSVKLDPYGEALFEELDNKAHDKLKGKLAHGYGGREVPTLEKDIDDQIMGLVKLLRNKYVSTVEKTVKCDFAAMTQYFTLDAITKIAYGKEFGYLAEEKDMYGFMKGVRDTLPTLILTAELPWWVGRIFWNPLVIGLIGPKRTDKAGIGAMLGVAEKVVAERFEPDNKTIKDRPDMLGAFLRHGVTRQQAVTEIPFQVVAGSDTTAVAIRGTILHLVANQTAYRKLQHEIDTAVREKRISSPVRYDEAREQLPYLQAVVYEGMRMQIPFTGLAMKQAPPAGDTLPDGRFVPGGTRVAHNMLGIQRNPKVYGEDADVFRPERFTLADKAKRVEMMQTVEMVFGYGRYACLGKPVAMMELHKVFVELLRRFDFDVLNPKHPWDEMNVNLFFHDNFWVRVTERFPDAIDSN